MLGAGRTLLHVCCMVTRQLTRAWVQMLPTARPATQGSGKGAHKFEVHGLIAPWVLHRLCRALQDAHGSDFQVTSMHCL